MPLCNLLRRLCDRSVFAFSSLFGKEDREAIIVVSFGTLEAVAGLLRLGVCKDQILIVDQGNIIDQGNIEHYAKSMAKIQVACHTEFIPFVEAYLGPQGTFLTRQAQAPCPRTGPLPACTQAESREERAGPLPPRKRSGPRKQKMEW